MPRANDRGRCGDRNLADRGWAERNSYRRRVAARYDEVARNVLALRHVAAINILLR